MELVPEQQCQDDPPSPLLLWMLIVLPLPSAETITTTIQDIYPAVMKKMRVVVTMGLCMLLFLLGLVCVTQV